jgi:hypothetical protein
MERLDVLRISHRPFLGRRFRVSIQVIVQDSALNALCLLILNSSDSWKVENWFCGSLMEFWLDWRIQLDLLCRLSFAVNIVYFHRKRLLGGSTGARTEFRCLKASNPSRRTTRTSFRSELLSLPEYPVELA